MARGAGAALDEAPSTGKRARATFQKRRQSCDLLAAHHLGVDAIHPHRIGPARIESRSCRLWASRTVPRWLSMMLKFDPAARPS